jgi:hypothetical protein
MQIEGIPEGWDLVRIGTPSEDEYYINAMGFPQKAHRSFYGGGICIVAPTPEQVSLLEQQNQASPESQP